MALFDVNACLGASLRLSECFSSLLVDIFSMAHHLMLATCIYFCTNLKYLTHFKGERHII